MTSDAPPVCYRHSDRTTRISCSDCGKPICPECTLDAAVGQKCPGCAAPENRTRIITARDTWKVGLATTPVTVSLIAINVIIFFIGEASVDSHRWLFDNFALFKLIGADEWWRTVTAAFLHGSFIHVGMNMYILYMLGPQLERQVGSVTFAALYLAAAAAGGAVSVLSGPAISNGALVVSIGASGAIFGLMGAWFSASYRNRHTPAGRVMFNQMLVWLGLSAVFPLFVPNIDWRAHVGGLAAGIIIHQLWNRLGTERAEPRLLRTLIAAAVGAMALAFVAFL